MAGRKKTECLVFYNYLLISLGIQQDRACINGKE
jgi:hypothetical protein